MWSFQLIRSFLCVWLYWPDPTASLSHLSLIICPPPLAPQTELPPDCFSVRCFRCCLPEPFPLLSCPPFPPAVCPPVSDLYLNAHFSGLYVKFFPEFRIFPGSHLFGLRLQLSRTAIYCGPIRLRRHVFITTFMSNRHTFPLVDDPRLRALVSAKSRYYYATYITDFAAFIWRNFVWFGLASVVAFLGGNSKCEYHSLKALVV